MNTYGNRVKEAVLSSQNDFVSSQWFYEPGINWPIVDTITKSKAVLPMSAFVFVTHMATHFDKQGT